MIKKSARVAAKRIGKDLAKNRIIITRTRVEVLLEEESVFGMTPDEVWNYLKAVVATKDGLDEIIERLMNI